MPYIIETERGYYAHFQGYETAATTTQFGVQFIFSRTLGASKLSPSSLPELGAATFDDAIDATVMANSLKRLRVVMQATVKKV